MTGFPRWKTITVLLALIFGVIFAVPNLFGEDPALQIARRNYEPMGPTPQQEIEDIVSAQEIAHADSFVDEGRLTLRFRNVPDQLKARDAIADQGADRYIVALTRATRMPKLLRELGLKPMSLGLDLRGGLYLLYQVDVDGAVAQLLERLEQEFRKTLRDAGVRYETIDRSGGELRVVLRDPGGVERARASLSEANPDLTIDVAGDGRTLLMRLRPEQIKERQDYAIQQNITTLRNRVNELGVSEPIVQRQGLDRINVQLPGVQNSAEVKDILGKTATLEFRLVDVASDVNEAVRLNRAPLGAKLYRDRDGNPVLLKRDVIVTGDQLTDATSGVTQQDGPVVFVKLAGRGATEMLKTTQTNLGRPMAVVFIEKVRRTVEKDGQKVDTDVTEEQVISVATIQGVFSSNFQISGLKLTEATNLALLLRAGSLAAPIFIIEERAIGPSLGQDNIEKGIDALMVGCLLLFVAMAVYYKGMGLIADVVLMFNVVLLAALLTLLQASLTLPGIAGIVLTVAMAVDANILIYERIREELRNGNSPLASIEAGFDKAFSAIADSNVTALIAGVVLFVFGTGPIKGFAITLCVGIATTLFTAILGSRAIIHFVYGRRGRVERLSI